MYLWEIISSIKCMNFKPLLSVIISSVCNIAFFREKHVLSESGEKYADHAVFTSANSSKQMCGFVFDVKGQQGVELFTGGSSGYYGLCILARSNGLKLKHLNDGFLSDKNSFSLHKTWIDGLESSVNYLWIIVMLGWPEGQYIFIFVWTTLMCLFIFAFLARS